MTLTSEVRRKIKGINKGEIFFINSIGLTESAVRLIRRYIQDGVMLPVRNEVVKVYKDVDSVMNGVVVLPQMHYIKMCEGR